MMELKCIDVSCICIMLFVIVFVILVVVVCIALFSEMSVLRPRQCTNQPSPWLTVLIFGIDSHLALFLVVTQR